MCVFWVTVKAGFRPVAHWLIGNEVPYPKERATVSGFVARQKSCCLQGVYQTLHVFIRDLFIGETSMAEAVDIILGASVVICFVAKEIDGKQTGSRAALIQFPARPEALVNESPRCHYAILSCGGNEKAPQRRKVASGGRRHSATGPYSTIVILLIRPCTRTLA
jgi:hypothetical protein